MRAGGFQDLVRIFSIPRGGRDFLGEYLSRTGIAAGSRHGGMLDAETPSETPFRNPLQKHLRKTPFRSPLQKHQGSDGGPPGSAQNMRGTGSKDSLNVKIWS